MADRRCYTDLERKFTSRKSFPESHRLVWLLRHWWPSVIVEQRHFGRFDFRTKLSFLQLRLALRTKFNWIGDHFRPFFPRKFRNPISLAFYRDFLNIFILSNIFDFFSPDSILNHDMYKLWKCQRIVLAQICINANTIVFLILAKHPTRIQLSTVQLTRAYTQALVRLW